MKSKIGLAVLIAAVAAPTAVVVPTAGVSAQGYYRTYNGKRHYYRYRCKKSKGTTGLLAGAGGGGLGAAALGAGPVGIAAGVIGGGLLGRHLDKKHDAAQNRRNGC